MYRKAFSLTLEVSSLMFLSSDNIRFVGAASSTNRVEACFGYFCVAEALTPASTEPGVWWIWYL